MEDSRGDIGDRVSRIQSEWRRERPDVDVQPHGIIGRVHRLAAWLTDELTVVYERYGLGEGEFDVLAALRRAGHPFERAPGELADHTMVTTGAMTKRIDRLVARGLVERREVEQDGRRRIVALTLAGLAWFLRRTLTWNEGNILKGARHIALGGHYAYIAADAGVVVLDLDDPLKPRVMQVLPASDARASALQFRYLWVTDRDGVKLFDVTDARKIVPVPEATVPLANARRIYVARTYAYVAAKQDGLVILNVTNPEKPKIYQKVTFNGQLNDAEDVIVGSTNASLYAYVADGRNGMKVIQLTSPASQPNFYGFSPAPKPELIAWARTPSPALAMSKGLDRDRGVDETGGQIAVFGRVGSRPFNRQEMERFYRNVGGVLYRVSDKGTFADWVPKKK